MKRIAIKDLFFPLKKPPLEMWKDEESEPGRGITVTVQAGMQWMTHQ